MNILFFQYQFEKDEIKTVIREVVQLQMGSHDYNQARVTHYTNHLVESCLARLTKMQKPFKYIGK